MALSTTATYADYNGSGVGSTPYPVPFQFTVPAHLQVRVKAGAGPWVLISPSQYTVTHDSSGMGSVVVTSGPIPTGSRVRIERHTPLVQSAAFPRSPVDPFARSLERAHDQAVMMLQERLSPYFDPRNKPTVTGTRSSGAALASLLQALHTVGFIDDQTSP